MQLYCFAITEVLLYIYLPCCIFSFCLHRFWSCDILDRFPDCGITFRLDVDLLNDCLVCFRGLDMSNILDSWLCWWGPGNVSRLLFDSRVLIFWFTWFRSCGDCGCVLVLIWVILNNRFWSTCSCNVCDRLLILILWLIWWLNRLWSTCSRDITWDLGYVSWLLDFQLVLFCDSNGLLVKWFLGCVLLRLRIWLIHDDFGSSTLDWSGSAWVPGSRLDRCWPACGCWAFSLCLDWVCNRLCLFFGEPFPGRGSRQSSSNFSFISIFAGWIGSRQWLDRFSFRCSWRRSWRFSSWLFDLLNNLRDGVWDCGVCGVILLLLLTCVV